MFHDVKSVAMPLFRLVIKEIIGLIIKFDNGDHENSSCYQLSIDIDIEAHISYTTGWYSKLPNFQFIHCFYSGLYKFADLTKSNTIQSIFRFRTYCVCKMKKKLPRVVLRRELLVARTPAWTGCMCMLGCLHLGGDIFHNRNKTKI